MLYISYGSNMNLEQMKWRCPNSKVYGIGKVYKWKLIFNYHADIIFTGRKKDFVPVVVWELDENIDLYTLDRYEGYPKYYIKKNITVVMENGKKVKAMVYVMNDNIKGIYPPEYSYAVCIRDGYLDNKIDLQPLYDAVKYSLDKNNLTEYNQYNSRSGLYE